MADLLDLDAGRIGSPKRSVVPPKNEMEKTKTHAVNYIRDNVCYRQA